MRVFLSIHGMRYAETFLHLRFAFTDCSGQFQALQPVLRDRMPATWIHKNYN